MFKSIEGVHVAIVGGGRFCKTFLQFILTEAETIGFRPPIVLGVADRNARAEGLQFARANGIFTTTDYRDLYRFENLQVLIELTNNLEMLEIIERSLPATVSLIDHIEIGSMWSLLKIQNEKARTLQAIAKNDRPENLPDLIESCVGRVVAIFSESARFARETEKGLIDSRQAISQVIDGTTIPTFVINQDHVVTHWNKACEQLTGYPASEIIGTQDQWKPFRARKRPIMADMILDGVSREDVRRYYGANWKKSPLIKDAYEVEEYFPHLGEGGKWLFFTGAPIKSSDGRIIGVIETLWDRTAKKQAEAERERHTRELATLCAIYRALSISDSLERCLEHACVEICNYFEAAAIHIYTRLEDGRYRLKHSQSCGLEKNLKQEPVDKDGLISQVGQSGQPALFEDTGSQIAGKQNGFSKNNPRALAYIPIKTRGKKVFGVIRLSTFKAHRFSPEERNVLDLIGNRIGAAIENAMLQAQYRKSEEKYRNLFNNAPNATFILDSRTFKILDTNTRMVASYGYRREELLGRSFLTLGPDDEELAAGLSQVDEKPSFIFTKKKHYRKDGQPIYVNINISAFKHDDSNLIIASTSDITESVAKEIQLVQAGKMTTLGTMAAGMAHEINQPLNVIQVCTDYLAKLVNRAADIEREELQATVDDIAGSVQRAAGIINHMRDFARQSDVNTTRVDINNPIRDVFKVLGYQLKAHRIELRLDLAADLPTILADHNRLEQVFINLVTNAIDAIDERENWPDNPPDWQRVLTIRSFSTNSSVVVTVSDTGTGMSREIVEKVFEPFFTTKKISRGTGLGTSISYGIVKEYNGTIDIESEVGRGTTFMLRFPI